MKKTLKAALVLIPIVVMCFVIAPAHADTLVFNLDTEFSGADPPEGGTPWATATFDDALDPYGANGVRLTMDASGLTDNEYISEWTFNFDPALDPTSLNFFGVDISDVATLSVSTGTNFYQPDGDGLFDIRFIMPPPPGDFTSKFTTGESLVVDILFTSPISVASFDYLSLGAGNSPDGLPTAAHAQGIGADDDGSGWITGGDGNGNGVPEPFTTTMLLLSGGYIGLLGLRRKFRK